MKKEKTRKFQNENSCWHFTHVNNSTLTAEKLHFHSIIYPLSARESRVCRTHVSTHTAPAPINVLFFLSFHCHSLGLLFSLLSLTIFTGLSSNDKTSSLSIEHFENSKNSSLSDDKVFSSTTSSSVEVPHAKMHPLSSILSPSEPMRHSIEYAMLDRRKRPSGKTIEDECEPFTVGDASARVFHSPGHSGMYAKNISCVKMIEGMKTC